MMSSLKAWVQRLLQGLGGGPEDKQQLIDLLHLARDKALLNNDALSMIEGVLQVSDLQVRDIMIPRAHMTVIGRDDPLEKILPVVIDSAHSRFPVIGEDRSEVIGIMLAKDVLPYWGLEGARRFDMREVLRSAVVVPESKRLDVLLKEFRSCRHHMAIVVDEYGSAAGLVTIEDVLEQIVGEIEDEFDFDEGAGILKRSEREFTVKAQTAIEDFNEFFGLELDDEAFDTIGGLVVNALGHMPKRGEKVNLAGFQFQVMRADSRRIHLLYARRLSDSPLDTGSP